jgi:hypothetical protein
MDLHMRRFGTCEIYVEVVDSKKSILETFNSFKEQELVLLESKAYFEAFKHTLESLQEMYVFPFTKTILGRSDATIAPPEFFKKSISTFSRISNIPLEEQRGLDILEVENIIPEELNNESEEEGEWGMRIERSDSLDVESKNSSEDECLPTVKQKEVQENNPLEESRRNSETALQVEFEELRKERLDQLVKR